MNGTVVRGVKVRVNSGRRGGGGGGGGNGPADEPPTVEQMGFH